MLNCNATCNGNQLVNARRTSAISAKQRQSFLLAGYTFASVAQQRLSTVYIIIQKHLKLTIVLKQLIHTSPDAGRVEF